MVGMKRRSNRALALFAALAAAIGVGVFAAAHSQEGTSPTSAASPPAAPGLTSTLPPSTESTPSTVAAITTTTTPVQSASHDPTLIPICESVAGATSAPRFGPTLGCRIVAAYGNPLAKGMGILGRLPTQAMLTDIAQRTAAWQKADPTRSHRCALELIAISVQATPGAAGLYRARMGADLIDSVLANARGAGCLLILDVQAGHSTVAAELLYLQPWLAQPDVHLALDPEWALPAGVTPGTRIGTMDGADVNVAVDLLVRLVDDAKLPPKMLIVHRFRSFMVSDPQSIKPTPNIRLVVNMDGFGPVSEKLSSYVVAQKGMPTKLTGMKLFFKLDRPLLGPGEVISLNPSPVFVNYQ